MPTSQNHHEPCRTSGCDHTDTGALISVELLRHLVRKVPKTAISVYAQLARLCHPDDQGGVFVSVPALARAIPCSQRAVCKALTALDRAAFIHRSRPDAGKPNYIRVIQHRSPGERAANCGGQAGASELTIQLVAELGREAVLTRRPRNAYLPMSGEFPHGRAKPGVSLDKSESALDSLVAKAYRLVTPVERSELFALAGDRALLSEGMGAVLADGGVAEDAPFGFFCAVLLQKLTTLKSEA